MTRRTSVWTAIAVVLATGGALLQTQTQPATPRGMASFLPGGPVLVLQAKDFAAILGDSETHAMRRLVAAAAFVVLARTDGGRAASQTALGKLAKDGPPMAQQTARLVLGLVANKADGMALLQELVP